MWIIAALTALMAWGVGGTVAFAHDGPTETTTLSAAHALPTVAAPPRFQVVTVVGQLELPTDMVELPNGDLLITEKGYGLDTRGTAHVRLVRQGVLLPEPVLRLSVNAFHDSGLLSILLDPAFADNGHFYLWYATGEEALGWTGTSVNRLSRFTFDLTTGKAVPGSETIILDEVPWFSLHNGGGLAFDAAGNLLIAMGDAMPFVDDPAGSPAQDLRTLQGKVLRIRPRANGGYTIPADNPFVDTPGARPEIYALGLRNPFRLAYRPSDGHIYLLDVGQYTWEEVNRLEPGANYGWPYREGPCPLSVRGPNCPPAPAEYTDPVFSYPHGVGSGITTLTFWDNRARLNPWPAAYDGAMLFADFNNRWLRWVDVDDPTQTIQPFVEDIGPLVDLAVSARGLYALSIFDGRLFHLEYRADGNQTPVAAWEVSALQGRAPLTVTLRADASRDPDGDALVYAWSMGDGTPPLITPEPSFTHVYTQDGSYLATLQVVDARGAASEVLADTITVYSGAFPTLVTENLTEVGRASFHGGDQFRFSAQRAGGTVGLNPTRPFVWTILLHHNEHVHTEVWEAPGDAITLTVPIGSHDLAPNVWYEVRLIMQTATGQRIHAATEIRPAITYLQMQSLPAGAALRINLQPDAAATPIPLIVGQRYGMDAPPRIIHDGYVGEFAYWMIFSGWPVPAGSLPTTVPEIITRREMTWRATPAPATFVAYYENIGPLARVFIPFAARRPPAAAP